MSGNIEGNPQADAREGLSAPVDTVVAQGGVPQSGTIDQITRALESAAQAGEWDVAKRLIAILETLKGGATQDAKVIDIASRRGKGGAQ
jgi:hypothetical protein